ncbi:hypothetical protein CDD81_3555 [Ophiocordyceps australis]|uniref:Zn(2)-C6 fungal-type domain-containing protein n=1 Tax=Ophiocordyceps australis TaxID=1399860 RepID=A0A2C5XX79_9HYPO|nr:hypothetical protein CDD81_3555 [Ophiocordyceps australis]
MQTTPDASCPQQASQACHNCRRLRHRCDRSYPHCRKCLAAGRECLGYGRLIRWTGAIASRGKWAGRTSNAPQDAAQRDRVPRGPRRRRPLLLEPVSDQALADVEEHVSEQQSPGLFDGDAGDDDEDRVHGAGWQLVARPSSSSSVTAPWVLVDPLFQDLSPSLRYYLSYYTQRLCKDLVCIDLPDSNPFRGLVSLTRGNPLLQHVIVAASAAHMANLHRAPLCQAKPPDAAVHEGNAEASVQRRVHQALADASARAQEDALVSKTKALASMRYAVANVDAVGGTDIVLAAALFFINLELIESGKHGWKAHLEGAGRIMSLLQPVVGGNETLRDYLLSDCFIYFILGSVFTPTAAFDPGPFFRSTQIPGVIERAANSYLCCPPEILAILYSASQLANDGDGQELSQDDVAATGRALFDAARAFDIVAWAERVCKLPYLRDSPVQSRIHAGTAHRLAACLYILQAVPALGARVDSDASLCGVAEELKADLFEHLALVPNDDDPNFKATTWPTFIAGAEAESLDRRQWIMERLRRLVVACPWGFIFTSMDTLQFIWSLDSQGRRPSSWIQMLKDPDLNFLIV